MKKVLIVAGIVSVALSSCTTSKLTTYSDDVYASPSQERAEKARLAAEKKKKEEELAKKQEEERAAELAAQKAKDDANPAYKDPVYNKDDYYDYQYASRIRRFNNPVYGAGYYDNYYTNSYMYNGNPAMYGTSIYSSYNYWGNNYYGCNSGWPSSYFGVSYGWGYPSYGYGYNPYGFGGYGYNSSAYWMGYNQGYNNGYYNGYYGYPYYGGYGYPYGGYGWGYFNQFDVNSGYGHAATNAPRGSHDGGNGGRVSGPGLYNNGIAQKFIQEGQAAQAMAPKFDNEIRSSRPLKNADNNNGVNGNSYDNHLGGYGNTNTNPKGNTYESIGTPHNGGINSGYDQPHIISNTSPKNGGGYNPNSIDVPKNTGNDSYNQPHIITPTKPVYEDKPIKQFDKGNVFDASPNFNNGGNSPSNSSPRGGSGSGGGGGHRPR